MEKHNFKLVFEPSLFQVVLVAKQQFSPKTSKSDEFFIKALGPTILAKLSAQCEFIRPKSANFVKFRIRTGEWKLNSPYMRINDEDLPAKVLVVNFS